MNFMILIGIVIIVVGFSLKLDVLAVVLTAGIATGLAAKMDILSILEIIGKAFVDNRLMSIFLISLPVIAVLESALSIRIGGHIQFIRPLIFPMAEAAAKSHKQNELTEKETEDLKSLSAAIENYGNFFAQNIFIGASGLLLIQGTLQESGYNVSLKDLSLFSIPMGIVAIILTIAQAYIYDKKIMSNKGGNK